VRWRTNVDPAIHPRAICSWHPLAELTDSLHHVQTYIEEVVRPTGQDTRTGQALSSEFGLLSRKRKAPGTDPTHSHVIAGLPTPDTSIYVSSRENSVTSTRPDSNDEEPRVYNGIVERKEGKIIAKGRVERKEGNTTVKPLGHRQRQIPFSEKNASKLPTSEMQKASLSAPVEQAVRMIQDAFKTKLRAVPNVRLENVVDDSMPSLDFTFINEFIMREGTSYADPATHIGCQAPCKPNMGQNIGCEYTRLCECLELAAVDERKLQTDDPKRYEEYIEAKENGEYIDTSGMPKRFPYERSKTEQGILPILQKFYREERYPIYECNQHCNCGPVCKSRVVQKGRRVPLVIFKTPNRGWGVKCDEDLRKGEFIDTYLGEVITNDEADRREETSKDKSSYLYSLDKFVGDYGAPETNKKCYVVDGQYIGSVTRFINHSCEPNCRQYTVSYNKHDLWVYQLAFFAYEDIPAGTELTFDYQDKDEEEEEDVVKRREEEKLKEADEGDDEEKPERVKCNCGAKKCQGWLWEG
jgi:[histone H3]-lysine9 N-trimethyltransferase SUV39H